MEVIATNRGLPDTKSRRFREYDLAHVDAEIADYVLVIRQGKPGLKEFEQTAYAVQEVGEEQEMPHGSRRPGAVFLLAKIDPADDDPERYTVYECFAPAMRGDRGTCSCIGQKTQTRCKHLDALEDACNGTK